MDPQTLVKVRTEAIGLDDRTAPSASETIRVASPKALTFATLPSDCPPTASARELPRIPVELRGTLSTPGPECEPAPGDRGPRGDPDRSAKAAWGGSSSRASTRSTRRGDQDRARLGGGAPRCARRCWPRGAITGHLEHPAVIPVHALGVDEEGRPVLVMKRVEGVTWSAFAATTPPIRPRGLRRGREPDRLDGPPRDPHAGVQRGPLRAQPRHRPPRHQAGERAHRSLRRGLPGDWGLAMRVTRAALRAAVRDAGVHGAGDGRRRRRSTRAPTSTCSARRSTSSSPAARRDTVGPTARAALWPAPRASAPVVYPASVPEYLAGANAATARQSGRRAHPPRRRSVEAVADYRRHKSSIALARTAADARLDAPRPARRAPTTALASEDPPRDIDLLIAEARFALEQGQARSGRRTRSPCAAGRSSTCCWPRVTRAPRSSVDGARDGFRHISYGQRAAAVTSLALVAVALSVHALLVDGRTITTRQLLYQSLGPLGAVTVLGLVLRRHLMRTALNRRALGGMCVLVATITTDRALGLVAGVSPSHVLLYDCLVAVAVASVGAVYIFRWIAGPPPSCSPPRSGPRSHRTRPCRPSRSPAPPASRSSSSSPRSTVADPAAPEATGSRGCR